MRFGYSIAYVQEVERSVVFYERAFGLKRRFVDESGRYAEMETGETTLAFSPRMSWATPTCPAASARMIRQSPQRAWR